MDYISYIRTSLKSQNNGLEAQNRVLEAFVASNGGNVLETYVEQVSGARNDRQELNKALNHCKRTGATLLVAKLDRVSRRVSFIASLMESNINLKVAELPNADAFQLHIYAALAEQERKLISQRTKSALRLLKSKGVQLGSPLNKVRQKEAKAFAVKIKPIIDDLKSQGICSLNKIANALNERKVQTFNGGKWYATTVKNTLGYLA